MLYITVHLYGRNGSQIEFRDYEKKALDIFRRHGGEVVVAYAPVRNLPARNPGDNGIPDEIQVLRIGSREAFERFLRDPERTVLAEERDAVIRKTEVFLSAELVEY